MSEAAGTGESAFGVRTVAILVAVGVIGFVGMLVLGAYAPGLRAGRNGGAHALSNAAVGFSGLVRLAEATGRHPRIVRDASVTGRGFDGEDLLVITPEDGTVNVSQALDRGGKPTLVVLPKWRTAADPDRRGWARYAGLQWTFVPEGVLAPVHRLAIVRHRSGGAALVTSPDLPAAIRFVAPRPLQVIRGLRRPSKGEPVHRLDALVTDGHGGIVLGRLDGRPLYVLADPDLLSNHGMRDPAQAAAALALLDWLNANQPTGIDFDVTLNGLGAARNPLRLMFDPPFLAMTLAVSAALLLAGWHATARFGAPRPRERGLAFGKAALVDNTAALVRRARREGMMGARYAAVIGERVRARLGGRAARDDTALDRLPGRARFTELAAAAAAARHPADLLAAARALDDWRGETR